MIDIKYKLIIPILAIILTGAAALATTISYAQSPQGKYTSIVQKLAEKFGLKQSDVQAVFDDTRQERQSQMQANFEERLNQDVKDGKITETQKQLIINKRKEIEANRQSEIQNMQGKTEEERKTAMESKKTAMQTQRQELESWAKQNNIDLQYLIPGRMGHFGGKKGGWYMK